MGANNWTDCPFCGAESQWPEYYEIGVWEGEFFANYRAQCHKCGEEFSFKHKAVLMTPEKINLRKKREELANAKESYEKALKKMTDAEEALRALDTSPTPVVE